MLALTVAVPLAATAAAQQTFATPEAAVEALMAALKADSDPAMIAILGEEHKDLIIQSDRATTSATRSRILQAMQTLRVLKEPSPNRRVLVIGDLAWPVPIPIVRAGDRWRFATEEGREEIINRRIGGNERNAMTVLRSYVDAQRAYAAVDRDGDGVLQYHPLESLAREAGFPELVSSGQRERFDAALSDLIVRWRNKHRFRSNMAAQRFLKRLRPDRGIRGDFLKENARILCSAAVELINLGVVKWR